MTNGPTPTPPPRNEGEYARKLALAILGTLESKGLLTQLDVDTILHAAYRSANASAVSEPAPASRATQPKGPAPVGPAALDTHWVKAPAPVVAASGPDQGQSSGASGPEPDGGSVIPAPGEAESAVVTAETPESSGPNSAGPNKEAEKPALEAMVIDFTLD